MRSSKANDSFWLKQAKLVKWIKEPKRAFKFKNQGNFESYPNSKINIYDNCVTNNIVKGYGNKNAIITINKKNDINYYTYFDLRNRINEFEKFLTNFFKSKKISAPRIMCHSSSSIESATLMLSCAKLGMHFTIIFEELEMQAVQSRIDLFKPDLFITRWNLKDAKKIIKNKYFYKKKVVSFAKIKELKINNVDKINSKFQKNYYTKDFFTLFTSGSTGTPKGIVHSYSGYFVYTKYTCKKAFGMNSKSVVLTASDAAWINGHTYALFGPLSFGATTVLLESPNIFLKFNVIKSILALKITILYLPVTIIRLAKSIYKNKKFKNKSIKTLGSMGEPLAPSVASWFAKFFSLKNKAIINTYFQTETGGIICSPVHSNSYLKYPHGSVGNSISKYLKINDLSKKKEIKIMTPWPGCMRRILNGHKIFSKYWDKKNNFRLFDYANKIKNNIYIHGRTDDVINIRGHRIGSEEIESVVLKLKEIVEATVVSVDDNLEGSVIYLFVVSNHKNIKRKIEKNILSNFGSFALPKKIIILSQLPKTRSGKILRRLLRSLIQREKILSDTSTIINPLIVNEIITKLNQL
jgi:acetyl-CoA synthetase